LFDIVTFLVVAFLIFIEIWLQVKSNKLYEEYEEIWNNVEVDEVNRVQKLSSLVVEYSVLINNNSIPKWVFIPFLGFLAYGASHLFLP